jgi:predicted phosphodiesterase
MRYGIFSDIHSNWDALEAVLAEFQNWKIDTYLCVGDIVGYGAEPSVCINKVKEITQSCVAGNHDFAVTGKLNIEFFNAYAKEAVLWTRQNINSDEMEYLRGLELTYMEQDVTLVHGSLDFPEIFDYIQTSYDAFRSLEALETKVCFLGHSHVPVTFFYGPTITYSMAEEIDLKGQEKVLINVGSVGQPRDEDPRACCAVYDTDEQKVWIRRVEYDIESAAAKIIKAGLPDLLAERLRYGR